MTEHNTLTIWVCYDCINLAANGSQPDPEWRDADQPAPLSGIPDDAEVTCGMTWADHADDCPNRLAESFDDECDCENDSFSSQPCDGCGTWLAGSHHAMTLWLQS